MRHEQLYFSFVVVTQLIALAGALLCFTSDDPQFTLHVSVISLPLDKVRWFWRMLCKQSPSDNGIGNLTSASLLRQPKMVLAWALQSRASHTINSQLLCSGDLAFKPSLKQGAVVQTQGRPCRKSSSVSVLLCICNSYWGVFYFQFLWYLLVLWDIFKAANQNILFWGSKSPRA